MIERETINYTEGRDGFKPGAIVLHITDSDETSALNTFGNPSSQVSAHYLVGDEYNYKLVDEKDTAWHAGKKVNPTHELVLNMEGVNPNKYTIGVEVASKGGFPSITKWFRWAKLIKDISKRNNIPLNKIGLINHNEIRSDKTCPGLWFNRAWAEILTKFV